MVGSQGAAVRWRNDCKETIQILRKQVFELFLMHVSMIYELIVSKIAIF